MAKIQDFEPEKLIIGVIYHDKEILDSAIEILTEKFEELYSIVKNEAENAPKTYLEFTERLKEYG
jgi:hypothetical protein